MNIRQLLTDYSQYLEECGYMDMDCLWSEIPCSVDCFLEEVKVEIVDAVLADVREIDYIFERLKHEAGRGRILNLEYEVASKAWQRLKEHFV